MPKIDLENLDVRTGSGYPGRLAEGYENRFVRRVGAAGGLTQYGANHVTLKPGAASAIRHWHEEQDEFAVVISGALVLVDDSGETPLKPGDCCTFPAGDPNGHCIVNKSDADAVFVVIGTHTKTETAWYPDMDMKVTMKDGSMSFTRNDGAPIEE